MTENKENEINNFNKRKCPQTLNDEETEIRTKISKFDKFESTFSRVSSGLTDSIKTSCKLSESVKSNANGDCVTPKKRIIDNCDEYTLVSTMSDRNPVLNRSISEASGINVRKSGLLDDSFECEGAARQRPAVTPTNFHFNPSSGTPETPCELAEIDLTVAQELPTDVLIGQRPRMRAAAARGRAGCPAFVDVSPMFYPRETRTQRTAPPERLGLPGDHIDLADASRAFVESEDANKIEEIDIDQMARIINDDFTTESLAFHTIDCRYPYEYEAGHIIGAVNAYTPWQLLRYVFLKDFSPDSLQEPTGDPLAAMKSLVKAITTIDQPKSNWKHQAFVFHCEFSSVRAPQLAKCLRNMDRIVNVDRYPRLYFPKIYIMKNGYNAFFYKYKELCDPQNYVPMLTEEIVEDLSCEDLELLLESVTSAGKTSSSKMSNEEQLQMYNLCKKESQEQMDIFTNLTKDSKMNEDK